VSRLFCATVLLVSLSVGIGAQQTFTEYRGAGYDLLISIPQSWHKTSENQPIEGQIVLVKAETSAAAITVAIDDIYQSLTDTGKLSAADTDRIGLDEMMTSNYNTIEQNITGSFQKLENVENLESSRTKLSGFDAIHVHASVKGGNVVNIMDQYYTLHNGIEYYITLSMLSDATKADRNVLQEAFQSILVKPQYIKGGPFARKVGKIAGTVWKYIVTISKNAFGYFIVGIIIAIPSTIIGIYRRRKRQAK